MVRTGLLPLLCLGTIIVFCTVGLSANPPADADAGLQSTLALQRAMETARHLMLSGDTRKAVDLLEEQLPRVNGHAAFLRLLREAYRAYIKDLWLANNTAGARRYLERLCILEPGAAQDASLRPPETTTKIVSPEPKAEPVKTPAGLFPNFALNSLKKGPKTPVQAAALTPSAVRAKVEDGLSSEDPFALANQQEGTQQAGNSQRAQELLRKAEEEFARNRFAEARVLFEQAYQTDKNCLSSSRGPWAYCMLNNVVEQLKQAGPARPPLPELQQQVRTAMALAPNLEETGKWLLREIDQRHATPAAGQDQVGEVGVQHLGRNKEGWQVAETAHFRIFHHQSREQVERAAAIAEKTRVDMFRKWFGTDGVEWTPKCELILHPTGSDYSRLTGVPANSPGHSRIESDPSGQRIIGRRMDLRCDNPGMLDAVLPHETTHVVLAGMLGNGNVPRWADEGIAVLTEPSHKIEQHRRNLVKAHQEGLLFGVMELMQLQDYPQPRRIAAFYAQSVCLVEFMAELRGPQVVTAFVRDGLREGYDAALRKHYGMNMNELQQRWQQRLTAQGNRVATAP